MIVVADTGPLNYLLQIGHIDALRLLYERVIFPPAVHEELLHTRAPSVVRSWASHLPLWVVVTGVGGPAFSDLSDLDAGEREAIQLALNLKIPAILIDELDGRRAALRLGLSPCGTLGVLKAASSIGQLDLKTAIARLLQTNFSVSPALVKQILEEE